MRSSLASLAAMAVSGRAGVFLPAIFRDGMVLQTPAEGGPPASIFGYADPSEAVTVNMTIGGITTTYAAVGDSTTGKWSTVVAPTGTDVEPSNVTFHIAAASDKAPIVIQNATFGEVILCNGQSNMVLSVSGASYAIGRAGPPSPPLQNSTWKNIRLFSVITQNATSPQRDLPTYINKTATRCNWGWTPNNPKGPGLGNMECQTWQTAVPGVTDFISAECFYTATQLLAINAIPAGRTIGLIQSAYSGTSMETWIPPQALDGCPMAALSSQANRSVSDIPNGPSCLWNAMIAPILGYGMRAVLHNQIESNMGDSFEYYTCVFQNMVSVWRQAWGIGVFPFLSTQLGDQGFSPDNGGEPGTWPSYVATPRDGQLSVLANRYPGVSRTSASGLVSSYDKGDRVGNPFGVWDVHSRFKGELGRRMALLFQNVTGLGLNSTSPMVDWDGPHPGNAITNADGSISFTWTTDASKGTYSNGTQDCWECCDGSRALDTFQLSISAADTNRTKFQAWTNASWTFDAASQAVTLTPIKPADPAHPYIVIRHQASLWPQCAWYSQTNDVPALSFSDLEVSLATG